MPFPSPLRKFRQPSRQEIITAERLKYRQGQRGAMDAITTMDEDVIFVMNPGLVVGTHENREREEILWSKIGHAIAEGIQVRRAGVSLHVHRGWHSTQRSDDGPRAFEPEEATAVKLIECLRSEGLDVFPPAEMDQTARLYNYGLDLRSVFTAALATRERFYNGVAGREAGPAAHIALVGLNGSRDLFHRSRREKPLELGSVLKVEGVLPRDCRFATTQLFP